MTNQRGLSVNQTFSRWAGFKQTSLSLPSVISGAKMESAVPYLMSLEWPGQIERPASHLILISEVSYSLLCFREKKIFLLQGHFTRPNAWTRVENLNKKLYRKACFLTEAGDFAWFPHLATGAAHLAVWVLVHLSPVTSGFSFLEHSADGWRRAGGSVSPNAFAFLLWLRPYVFSASKIGSHYGCYIARVTQCRSKQLTYVLFFSPLQKNYMPDRFYKVAIK